MRRKDIIVISVLINAGLLVALFSSGLKTKDKESPLLDQESVAGYVAQNMERIVEKEPAVEEPKTTVVANKSSQTRKELAYDFNEEVKRTPVQADGSYTVIQVKKGDMLEKLARTYNTTVEQIIELNNLSSTRLNIGQVLRIPHAQASTTPVASGDDDCYYVVKSGDNPWTIASKNNIKVEELLRLNQLTEEKARRLRPGDKLRIR